MQTNLISIDAWESEEAKIRRQLAKGGGGGDNGDMETRVATLDKNLTVLTAEVASFKNEAFRTFATKADLVEAKNQIIMWVVSAIFLAQLLPALLKKFGI